VIERCAPRGRVRVRAEVWNARSAAPLEVGEPARIEGVEGLTLVVAPVTERRQDEGGRAV
jgi:membrane protein implicated in regulation of membrane protease activity